MNIIKFAASFVLALIIAVYAYTKDELLWLWVSTLLIILGVYLLRRNSSGTVRKASSIFTYLLLVIGVIVALVLVVYFFLMRDFSNSFNR